VRRPPPWPAGRVSGAVAAALDTAWHQVLTHANRQPDPAGLVTAYAAARAIDFFERGVVLALDRAQCAMGLDEPERVRALADLLSASFGQRIAVVVEPVAEEQV
jgi:hypothetical protein